MRRHSYMEPFSGEFVMPADVVEGLDPAHTPSHPAKMQDLTGQELAGRYQLLEVVGGGGMGTVYRATDLRATKEVAVKVLDPRFDPAKDPAYRERFLREARLSTRLSHGNIVEVLDTGESEGVHFIAMELLHGKTLAQLLETEKTIGWERVLKLVRQMCAGLAFAHELGLVHRDLKPANCFVLGEGASEWVKLLDFGLAKPMRKSEPENEEVTGTSMLMGSPTYMAPEQARGEASAESDIYALGVMMYRMLSGVVPFVGRTAIDVIVHHIQTPLPWLAEVAAGIDVPMEFELVMRRCLEKDPRSRYASVHALMTALDDAEAGARRSPEQRMAAMPLALARKLTPAPQATAPQPLEAPAGPLFAAARHEPKGRAPIVGVLMAALLGGGAFFAWRSASTSETIEASAAAVEKAPAAPIAPEPTTPPVAAAAVEPVAAPAPEAKPAGPVTFRINSIPTGATVKVGTKVMGTTPAIFQIEADDTGEATAELTLELKGYQSITFIATSPGPRFDLTQRLQKGSGRVQLARAPASDREEESLFVPVPVSAAGGSAKSAPPAPAAAAAAKVEPEPAIVPAAVVAVPTPVTPPPAAQAALTAPGIAQADQLTVRPKLVNPGVAPRYSEQARAAKVEGTAVARCIVTLQGKLDQCRLVKPLPMMDEAILEALKTRTYEPGRAGNDPVASEINIVLRVQR